MLKTIHENKPLQLLLGAFIGFCFGFLLQRGGVTRYDVIMGQLLLYDWTVAKVILTAVVTGMIGIYFMNYMGLVKMHIKTGSIGSTVIGGLIFGVGFALLGYCPGTIVGAAGQGSLDALFGGIIGILIGAGLYSRMYPWLSKHVLKIGYFGDQTIPQVLGTNAYKVVAGAAVLIIIFLIILEIAGV